MDRIALLFQAIETAHFRQIDQRRRYENRFFSTLDSFIDINAGNGKMPSAFGGAPKQASENSVGGGQRHLAPSADGVC